MDAYKGTVELIGGLTPKNGGDFPLMAAKDIQVDDEGKRLDEKLQELSDGVSGVTPVFEVDEVVTLEPGENAYVDIDNAEPATPRISFGIPRGEAGPSGGLVVIDVLHDIESSTVTASHSADEIFKLVQKHTSVVIACVNGQFYYQYSKAILDETGVATHVDFCYSEFNKNDIYVTTCWLTIDQNKEGTLLYKAMVPSSSSGGSSGTGDTKAIEEMLQGFDSDPGSVKTYVDEGLATKVDAVEGKGLSTNDFTDELKNQIRLNQQEAQEIEKNALKLDGIADEQGAVKTYIDDGLAGKVDAVEGKGLSTNDFTDEAKGKIDNLQQNFEFIDEALAGKVDAVEGKGLSTNDFTDELKKQVEDNKDALDAVGFEFVKLDGFANEEGSIKKYVDNGLDGKVGARVDGETLVLS